METGRAPGQRAGLTHAAILAAAQELLAEGGLDALTMRALARRLQVTPNALYSHTSSKTQLLDDLLDEALASVESPRTDAEDPIAALAGLMTSTYAVLTAHPDLVPLYLARQGARGPNAIRLGEVMDGLLARAGVIGAPAAEARRALIVHTIGFAAFATGSPLTPESDRPLPPQALHANFSAGLRWLLAGIVQGTVAPAAD